MSGKATRRFKQGLLALGGVVAGLGVLGSLYTTGICACASVAQEVLRTSSVKTDPDSRKVLQRVAERRFPIGTAQAQVVGQIGFKRYARYCLQARGGAALVCMFPHDRNFWRETHVQLGFAFDAERRIDSVRAEPVVRTTWF